MTRHNVISACDCHGIGALDNFCDEITGQCKCDENAYGRRCNECEPGYWNFPNCEPCKLRLEILFNLSYIFYIFQWFIYEFFYRINFEKVNVMVMRQYAKQKLESALTADTQQKDFIVRYALKGGTEIQRKWNYPYFHYWLNCNYVCLFNETFLYTEYFSLQWRWVEYSMSWMSLSQYTKIWTFICWYMLVTSQWR